MQARGKIKPFAAWILILILTVSLMPVSAMGEAIEEPDEGIRIEVIPDEAAESVTEEITESSIPDETDTAHETDTNAGNSIESEAESPSAEEPKDSAVRPEESMPDTGFLDDEAPDEDLSGTENETFDQDGEQSDESAEQPIDEVIPEADPGTAESSESGSSSEDQESEKLSLKESIEKYGHVYVMTTRPARIFESPALKADTLIYIAESASSLLLATFYTAHDTVVVWFLDEDENVVNGFISAKDLDSHYLLDEDIRPIDYIPSGKGSTAIGTMKLFVAAGTYAAAEEDDFAEPVETSESEAPLQYDVAYL